MGIRKSVGKNRKSDQPAAAASVAREGRKADNARTAPKPKRGSR